MSAEPPSLENLLVGWRDRLGKATPVARVGRVLKVTGLVVEAEGPNVSLGDVCLIRSDRIPEPIPAEVVGFREQTVLLMPLGPMQSMHAGCEVVVSDRADTIEAGPGLLGRILDGLGNPIDGAGPLPPGEPRPIHAAPPNPLHRQRITEPLSTGIKAIDLFTPLGCGQRLGIFAGSGVGKSTLLGMIARGSDAEINVIALVGERGRELREFIEKDLGPEGMARSIVVVSTSDQPAPMRMRAALLATSIAEYFRDQGRKVLFMMDSVTRFAMAQREIGLAVGEPPTSRGYTPSVFALLPRLLERTGMGATGSITALYTVLVDGDDFNEPISDAVRSILDGHLVLSRALATANHYPSIDVLESVSRLTLEICSPKEVQAAGKARDLLAVYRKNEDVITIGAYAKGSSQRIDLAVDRQPKLMELLRQPVTERVPRANSFKQLEAVLA